MRILYIFILSATLCAFVLALRGDFHPEIRGFFHRCASFFRVFGIPAAIFPTLIVLIARQLHLLHW